VQWRALGASCAAAGLLTLVLVIVGVDDSFDIPLIEGLSAFACALGALFVVAADRLPSRLIAAALVLGIGIVSTAVLASGEADTPFILYYVWIAVLAWYFLRARAAAVLTGAVAVTSAATMATAATGPDNAATWWLMLAGTITMVSALAAVLRVRADRLVAALADAAAHDPLTGLLNRAGFEERSATELARARRHRMPVAVVLADIDHFKAVNDTFGHRRGDEALATFAGLSRGATRPEDLIARLGGEEFAFVLVGTDEAGAVAAAERLRAATHQHLAGPDGRPVTVSFGVAAAPGRDANIQTLLDQADRATYSAKLRGRDQTVAFSAVNATEVLGRSAGRRSL
jgi:diguanylate cyclase (GGDEF)-like protein